MEPIDINTFDIQTCIETSMKDVFETMLSMKLEPTTKVTRESLNSIQFAGSVSLVGDIMGRVGIQISDVFAKIMTASMLGMELEEIEDEEEALDVIREVTNMVGGNLKSGFCDSGLSCKLSVPTITTGTNFKIEPVKYSRSERFAFRFEEHIIFAEIFIKKGE